MISKEFAFNTFILLSIISFGIFGSLSHLFNLAIILMLIFNFLINRTDLEITPNSKSLFLALCSLFYIFLIRGFTHHDIWASIESLSPMLPIPAIGLMILLANRETYRLDPGRLALFSKIAVCSSFLVYLIIFNVLGEQYDQYIFFNGRLNLFSGNPVPFSTVIFGITIFCLIDWKTANIQHRIVTIACVFLGIYLAGIEAEARGTLLAIVLSGPIILWFVFRSIFLSLLISLSVILPGYFFMVNGSNLIDNDYISRVFRGLQTLFSENKTDNSMVWRINIWEAALKTIKDLPPFGYDVSNRFAAITPYLPEGFKRSYTHSHNDIFSSIISVGFIGAAFSFLSLLSPIWGALLSDNQKETKLFIATAITIGILCTANVNTIFFNDITAGWLAFSSFLIWNVKFSDKDTFNVKF